MKPEIKQRIEQIKNGIIPEGYKKTKVGMVPVEWEIKKLSDVLQKQTQKNTENLIHNVLTNSALQGIISQSEYFDKQIANDDNTNGYYIVRQGYFVYNPRISMNAPCGPFNKYYSKEDGVMSPLYTVYKYIDQSPYYSDYLAYFFMSANWYGYMNSIANYGARSDRMNITSEDMNRMPLPYPPLHEQEKIAKILQTQDKVIELKEKLLEEKKRQKKYLMQQLLTGKKRLPGFSGEWKKYKMKQFVTIINNSIDPQINAKEMYTVFSLPAYDNNKTPEYLSGAEMKSNKFIVEKGMILFNKLNVRQKRIWYISTKYDFQMLSSTEFLPLEIKNIEKEYLMYYLSSDNITEGFIRKSSGTSNSQQRISISDLLNLEINIPDYNEQKSITIILSREDKEIELLQKDLEKEQQKK